MMVFGSSVCVSKAIGRNIDQLLVFLMLATFKVHLKCTEQKCYTFPLISGVQVSLQIQLFKSSGGPPLS